MMILDMNKNAKTNHYPLNKNPVDSVARIVGSGWLSTS
jgi:hypothetical protein